jgi:general stress protein 26
MSESSSSGSTNEQHEQIETVRSIIKDVRTCMFTTADADGALHAAPMTTQDTEFDGDAWFIAGADSETVRNLTARPQVNVAYAGATSWVSLSGTAAVVNDPAKKKELWNTFTEAWFPGGADDPQVVTVKVSGQSAQYWDSPGRLAMTMSMVKARVTGDTPDAGESDTVEL